MLRTRFFKKDNGNILKNTTLEKLQELFMWMLELITIDNNKVSIDNLYLTGDLAFMIILKGKEFSSPKWYFKCKLHR